MNEERERRKQERTRMMFGLFAGLIIAVSLGYVIFTAPDVCGDFRYATAYSYTYSGEFFLENCDCGQKSFWMPYIEYSTWEFKADDVRSVAEVLGMSNYTLNYQDGVFTVTSANSTLTMGAGYVDYSMTEIPKMEVNFTRDRITEIVSSYLKNLSVVLPKNAELRIVSVEDGRTSEVITNGSSVVYTKVVKLEPFFDGYPMFLPVEVEVDSRGEIVSFSSHPIVLSKNGMVKVPSMEELRGWMEREGVPVPEEPSRISKLVVKNVQMGYSMSSGYLVPTYRLTIFIYEGSDPVGKYSLQVAWNPCMVGK